MKKELTEKEYWNYNYSKLSSVRPLSIEGYKNHCARTLLKVTESVELSNKTVLEIGGGGSQLLAFLAKRYPNSIFTAIDYSKVGCALIENYARQDGLNNLRTICANLFDVAPNTEVFDIVYSLGVVEHFKELSQVLSAMKKRLKKNGRLITFIPNLLGINGRLTRIFNKQVFDIHVPHDIDSFINGHLEIGFDIIEAGYLCSNNFGVLSSCFKKDEGFKWKIYKFLTRISNIIWAFESKVIELPATRFFSPYIYVIAKNN